MRGEATENRSSEISARGLSGLGNRRSIQLSYGAEPTTNEKHMLSSTSQTVQPPAETPLCVIPTHPATPPGATVRHDNTGDEIVAEETWRGGRVRINRKGERVYVIEAMRLGVRYVITLGALTETQALAELALFDRDPIGFRTKKQAQIAAALMAVRMDPERVKAFLAYLAAEGRTTEYIVNVRHSLGWWSEENRIEQRDLRGVALVELLRWLNGAPGQRHKIIHLKSFCAWLRKRGELAQNHDPTLALPVPKAEPEKNDREKLHTMREVEAAYRMTADQAIRDVICIRTKTGMHYTEVGRLAKGEGEIRELRDHGEIAGTITFRHKKGSQHTISIDAQVLAAVKRLRTRGSAPSDSWMLKVLKAQAAANHVEPLELGALRHSFSTWAADEGVEVRPNNRGLSMEQVAAVMGHESTRTTRKFYNASKVPPMVKLPALRLFHPDDPVAMPAKTEAENG